MKILLDTNIILDIIMEREPFSADAVKILVLADTKKIEAYITSNSITDIFYVLRKYFTDKEDRKKAVQYILNIVNIVSVTKTDIFKALELDYTDFEDAVQTQCAKKIKAEYIITRNKKDYRDESIPVLPPSEFIQLV